MPLDGGLWSGFCNELESRTAHLAGEFSAAWRDLAALIAAQRDAFAILNKPEPPADRPQSLAAFFEGVAPVLLAEPLAVYARKRPIARSLAAMEEYESNLEDLLRRLPRAAELSGRELAGLSSGSRRSLAGLYRPFQRRPRPIRLREAVSDHIQERILRRAALDGAFQLLLAQSAFHLLVPWQACRRAFLSALTQSERERADLAGTRGWWTGEAARYEQRAAVLLARYEGWAGPVAETAAAGLLRRPRPAAGGKRAAWAKEHQKHLSFWSRQQRAVRAVLDLELHLVQLAREMTAETLAAVKALEAEHQELIAELDSAIAWLQGWSGGPDAASLPQPKARLLSSEEHLSEWLRRVSAATRGQLPLTTETVAPRPALPGWRRPWRDLEPTKEFLSALSTAGAPILLSGLREAEAVHRAIVREVERAREVVDFGIETARLEGATGEALAREAVGNALSLLTYQKSAIPAVRAGMESAAARAEAVVLAESDLALEKGRIGLLAHVTRQRGGQALRQLRGLTASTVQASSRRLWSGALRLYRWALLKIGWIAPRRQAAEPVVRRAELGETLAVQLRARDLPMIYRRLFRLAPVEDPRFLVGREAEMAGFADALKCWESGKGASVIVIGARGSGKTSLINCAVAGVFPHCEVIRGQFADRLLTPPQMTNFVRDLLQVPAEGDVVAALRGCRRVILIEEFERTFLRTVNGFGALRMLLDLMYSTARSTLWVFSVNETAYRYLDAVVGLGRHFSHRINAMSVKQEDLTNAILQRHGLSGLRMEFAPLPEEDPRVSRLRRFLGLEQDPQKLFLEALYEQSEGIFRAAFELWQGSIERVEGGIVHMRQPLAPDYQRLASEMTLEDCFVLKAILQHGSLTAEEVAPVLAIGPEESVRQLERLHVLEVLEPEPASPGVRVRPEAGRLVRETLSRRNLL
ncbi:MAG TPA: ATP-binding protein [Bryobacteraceae bacterium]|nr:ATP-binding protein [Bryobacteraceae bacterium]